MPFTRVCLLSLSLYIPYTCLSLGTYVQLHVSTLYVRPSRILTRVHSFLKNLHVFYTCLPSSLSLYITYTCLLYSLDIYVQLHVPTLYVRHPRIFTTHVHLFLRYLRAFYTCLSSSLRLYVPSHVSYFLTHTTYFDSA
jgi:hypothetical protein